MGPLTLAVVRLIGPLHLASVQNIRNLGEAGMLGEPPGNCQAGVLTAVESGGPAASIQALP